MMSVETIKVRMVGAAPLLMHNGCLADPLDERSINLAAITGKRAKTRADHEEISRLEWFGGLWLNDKRPCLPAAAVKAALVDAARTRKKGKAATAGLWIDGPAMLSYDGPSDVRELWEDPRYRLRTGVRVREATTMRTRGRFPEWSADVTATFLTGVLSKSEVAEFFKIAGFLVGIGDWRPEYGRFTAVQIE
jgi:hypothetical protein